MVLGFLNSSFIIFYLPGSAYSPLPLRTHAQEARGRGMEEVIAPDNHLASSSCQFEAVLNNQAPPTAIYATANIQGSHPSTLYHSSNSAGGHMSNSIPHQNPNSGSTSTSSHPIPSTKKKPAPLPPVRTPPTPPKKAPLRLPQENTWRGNHTWRTLWLSPPTYILEGLENTRILSGLAICTSNSH